MTAGRRPWPSLLIEPYGIEINTLRYELCLFISLLIEPYGIEIGLHHVAVCVVQGCF